MSVFVSAASITAIAGGCGWLSGDSEGGQDVQEPNDAVSDEGGLYLPDVVVPRNLEASRGDYSDKIVLTWIPGTPGPWEVMRCNSNEIPCAGNAYAKIADLPEGSARFEDTSPPVNVIGQYRLHMKLTSVNESSEYSSSSAWGYAAGTLAGPTDMTATTDSRTDAIEIGVKMPWLCPELAGGCKATVFRAPTDKGPWVPMVYFSAQEFSWLDTSVPGGVTYYYKAMAAYDPPTMPGGSLNSADSGIASGRRALASDGSTSWGYDPMALGDGRYHGFFEIPRQIAVDPKTGDVYVADRATPRVQKFDADGTFLTTFGDAFALEAYGSRRFIHPVGVAVDSQGDVFVADNDADSGGSFARIVRLSADGEVEAEWDHVFEFGMYASALSKIGVDKDGHVWAVVDGMGGSGPGLVIWDRDGTTLLKSDGTGPGCSEPVQLGCSFQAADGGGMWLFCPAAGKIRKYSADGQPVNCSQYSVSSVLFAAAAVVHPNGSLYVGASADLTNHPERNNFKMLHKLGQDGSVVSSWGPWGSGSELLFAVDSMAIAPDGSLYLLDGITQSSEGDYVGNRMVVHVPAF